MKDNWSRALLHFLCIVLSIFNSCELFQQEQTTEATTIPISRGQTTKQPSEELSSSETTEVTTNAFTYQNTVVSEKISEQSTETTAIPISRGQTTKRPSADFSPQLLLTDSKRIIILDTATGNETIVAEGYIYVLFVAYHQSKNFIFWCDYHGGTISRINYPSIDKTPAEVIIIGSYPVGIAVDSINDHLYWTDFGHSSIFRSNIDGLNATTILSYIHAIDIELDIKNGWLYFTGNYGITIEKCRMDGTDRQTILRVILSENILLDFEEGRLYWTEHDTFKIRSALLNGSDITTIYDVSPWSYYLMGFDISESHIYFSAWTIGQLYAIPRYDQDAEGELIYSSNLYMMDVKIYKFSDKECLEYNVIRHEEKRSAGYGTDVLLDIPITDEGLEHAWYRIESVNGDDMPTDAPGIFHCGTYNPIWLNGSLPEYVDKNVTAEACLQTADHICEKSIYITITNCGTFYVYYLRNTTQNSAYCFGSGPVLCPLGFSSDDGYYPGCSSLFPNETVLPVVEPALVEGDTFDSIPLYPKTPSLVTVFRCKFDEVTEGSYVYDIFWHINGDFVKKVLNISYTQVNTTDLRNSDWKNTHHLNMKVSCSVRIRYNLTNAIPSPFHRSTDFNAGIFPEHYEYTVLEGQSVNIILTSTVPVGCIVSDPDFRKSHCHQNIYVFQPNIDENTKQCANGLAKKDILFKSQFCGLKLRSSDWQNNTVLQVYGFSDGLYNFQGRTAYIRLSVTSVSILNDMWMNLQVPDIKINVLDKDYLLTGRLCQSYNDPHMTTFDGKTYHYMDIGEYVLYRNDRGPYWVHVLFTNCGFGWTHSSCNCGIAVRSRRSLFVIRTCEKIARDDRYLLQQPHIEIRSCDDSDLSIEHTYNNYKITLPTGTVIEFSISSWFMFISRISIKPSISDINNAKGLCGVPSVTKDTSDDFMHRDLGTVFDYKSFADSWRINSTTMLDESLFIPEPEFLHKSNVDTGYKMNSTAGTTERYCVCEKQASQADDLELFYSSQCNLTESTETCLSAQQNYVDDNTISPFVTICEPSYYRQKRSTDHRIIRRSLSDTDDISDVKPLEMDDDLSIDPETPEFRNGWTEEKANQTCYERIENGIPTDLFGAVTGLSISDYIESCILDIKLTADTSFVQDTVGAMQTYTIMEVSRNEIMAETKTENGSQTMLEYITSLLCRNNCSNNGNCTSGSCTCKDGFIGDDCSNEITVPPTNTSLPTSGLCSTRTRACERTNIYGFFQSRNVWCNKTHFQINGNSKTYTETVIVMAEYRNSFMVSVDLNGNRNKRSIMDPVMAEGYELRMSNNGIEFGDAVNLIIYDEDCYDCNASSISCVVIDSCPDFTTTNMDTTTTDNSSTSLTHTLSLTVKAVESTTSQKTQTTEQFITSDSITKTNKPNQGSTQFGIITTDKTVFEISTYKKTTTVTASTLSDTALPVENSSTKQLTSVKSTTNEPTYATEQLKTLQKTSTNQELSTTDTTLIDAPSAQIFTRKESTTTGRSAVTETTRVMESTTKNEPPTYKKSTTPDEITKYKETTTSYVTPTYKELTPLDETTIYREQTTYKDTTRSDKTTTYKIPTEKDGKASYKPTTEETTTLVESKTTDKTSTYKEVVTSDESTTTDKTTKYKKPTITDETTTKKESTTKAEPTFKESTTTYEPTIQDETTTYEPTTTDETTTYKGSTIPDETTTKDEPTTHKESTTYKEPTTDDSTTGKEPTTTDETSTDKTTTDETRTDKTTKYKGSTIPDETTTKDEPTTHKKSTTNKEPTTYKEPTTDDSTTDKTTTDKEPTTDDSTTDKTTTDKEPTTKDETPTDKITTDKTTTYKGSTIPDETTTKDEPTTHKESTTNKEPTTYKEPTTDKTTTDKEPTTKDETPTDKITTDKTTTYKGSTIPDETATKDEPTTCKESTTYKEPTTDDSTTDKTTNGKEPTTTDETTTDTTTTYKGLTIPDETTTQDEPTIFKEPTTTDKTTTKDELTTYKEPTTTDETKTYKKSTIDEITTDKRTTKEPTIPDETTTYKESTTTDETTTYKEPTTTDKTTTYKQSTVDETTTGKTTVTNEPTIPVETTKYKVPTTTDETTTYKESTIDKTTIGKTTTTKTTTTNEPTIQHEPRTYKESTTETTTLKQSTTTDMTDVDITTVLKSTPKPTSSKLATTDGSTVTTVTKTTEAVIIDADEVISYIGPIFIGGSVLLFIVIVCAILLIRFILERARQRKQENIDNTSVFDSWDIYTRKTNDETKNEDKLATPDFVHASRINTRPSVSSISSNTYSQRNFFEDYCQQ